MLRSASRTGTFAALTATRSPFTCSLWSGATGQTAETIVYRPLETGVAAHDWAVVGHVTPELANCGPAVLMRDGSGLWWFRDARAGLEPIAGSRAEEVLSAAVTPPPDPVRAPGARRLAPYRSPSLTTGHVRLSPASRFPSSVALAHGRAAA